MGIWPLIATLATGASALGLVCAVLIQQRRIRALTTRIFSVEQSDPLTGLLNRRSFEEQLERELERANRSGGHVTVIVGDLDGLAAVNEHHGHAVGDEVLRLVAAELVKWKRRIDHGGRIGGEELAVLLPDTDEGGAFLVAERLRRATHRRLADAPAAVTVSFGVASCPEHADGGPALLDAAYRALASAKELGGDRSVIYSPEVTRMLAASGGPAGVDLQLATVVALAEALDIRDTGTARHSHSVAEYAELMAVELGLDADRTERVRLAGLLHDVGKIGVCDQVLAKPGPLDDSEWREMRTHPEIAARLLARPEFDDLRAWILAHHERPDGRGYPYGLTGEQIPLEARILAVADAYEAMTADRVYRPALGEKAARGELEGGAGSQFDAAVVDALLGALRRTGESPAGDVVRFAR